jgi:type IV fimbrial biogenesis protein FimT
MSRTRFMSHRGFTLLELMITVAVLAILIALSAPSFSEYFEKARLRGAADDIVTLLASARGEAVKRNRDVRVNFGGTTSAWCLGANAAANPANSGDAIPAPVACDCTNAAQCTIGGERYVVDASRYPNVSVGGAGTAFIFDRSLGTQHQIGSDTPAATAVTFTSSPRSYRLRLNVSALGHSTVCVPSGSLAISGYKSC